MVPDVAVDRGSQRISLRASQSQQLKRESLFDGFTYEGTQPGAVSGGGSRLRARSDEDHLAGLSDGESEEADSD
jgi:hypothetical protein|eukprot:COSAG06_NODE_42029_length_385_cov_1.066434_1_plen_74_part_00